MAPDNQKFTKGDLARLLNKLASGVQLHGARVGLHIFGGAALVLGNQSPREVTGDIDAHVETPAERILLQKLRRPIAEEEGVRPTWLSINHARPLDELIAEREQHFTPTLPELGAKGLDVYLLNPEPQIAIKILGYRGEKDEADLQGLMRTAGIFKRGDLNRVWEKYKGRFQTDRDRMADANLRAKELVIPKKGPRPGAGARSGRGPGNRRP